MNTQEKLAAAEARAIAAERAIELCLTSASGGVSATHAIRGLYLRSEALNLAAARELMAKAEQWDFIAMHLDNYAYSTDPLWRRVEELISELAKQSQKAASLSAYRDGVLEEIAKWAENMGKMDGDCTLSPSEIRAMKGQSK